MKNSEYVLGTLILLLISVVYAQDEYLTPGCVYEMQNTYINTITCSDLNRDGIIEIIAGSNGGTIYDLTYGDCDLQWSPRWQRINLRGEIKEIKVVDVDKDGENEVVAISDGRDYYLFVLNEDNLFEWYEEKVGAPSISLDVADLENDGDNEIIIGTKNKKVFVLDGEGDARWEADLKNIPYYVKASDLDNDGMLEVIVMDNQYRDAHIYVFNSSGKLLWTYLIKEGIYQPSKQSLAVEDINNDGMKEIIFATSKEGLGVLNNKGNILWRYPLQSVVSAVHVDDIDNDGRSDILVASPPYLYAIDGEGEMKWKALVNSSMFSIKTGNLNSDPLKEIVVGTGESIQIFNHNGGLLGEWILTNKKETKSVEFRNICIADLDNDGVNEIAVGLNIIERRLDINYYVGEIRVFEVDEEYEREVTPVETTVTTAPQTTTAPTTAPATTIATTAPTTAPQTTVTTTSVPGEAADLTSYLPIILLIFFIIIVFVVLAAVYVYVSKRKRQETAEKPAPIETRVVDELTRLKTEEEKIEEMIKLAHVKSDKRKKDEAALEEIEEDQKKKLTETKAKIKEIEKEEKKVEEHKCGKCGRVFATERGLHVHKSRCKG